MLFDTDGIIEKDHKLKRAGNGGGEHGEAIRQTNRKIELINKAFAFPMNFQFHSSFLEIFVFVLTKRIFGILYEELLKFVGAFIMFIFFVNADCCEFFHWRWLFLPGIFNFP